MLPNLSELKKKCDDLSLTVVQKGKRPAKSDYVEVLRAHYMPEGGLPYEELTPMLCFAEWNLKEDERERIWRSVNWVIQKKLNGCRIILHFVKGVGVFAHSRTTSVKTFRFQELQQQFTWHDYVPNFSATLDAEVIIEKPIDTRAYTAKGEITKTSLHSTTSVLHLEAENARKIQIEQDAPLMVHAFDITSSDLRTAIGEDHRKEPYSTRIELLKIFEDVIRKTSLSKFFHFPKVERANKKEFLNKILAEGGEGGILKNLRAPYVDSSSRKRDGWVKVKRRQDYDAFVSGFIRGEKGTGWENLVGALEFSVITEKGVHVLGYASNITLENRKKITIYDPKSDEVTLAPAILGKVAEISGQDISARSLRLSHCIVERWRPKQGPDAKNRGDCRYKMSDLLAASSWVG